MLHSVSLYHHAKNQKNLIVMFLRKCQKPNFLTLNPLLIPGLFFETGHLGQMLHSVGLYHHAKNKKIYGSVSEKKSKNQIL